ncbi:TOMM precursor leader peptide-binding protein [Actinopolymorpha sp. NPDC004070]|uniref:TOMM precursor leader peptide-binding protein n=1 Tax=Actinopolymorpha sp. NPDC004070 TaxID=3154548 RepID=UPI0033B8E8B4
MTTTDAALVSLVPGAVLLDSGPDETHVMLPNHNVTFLNAEVTRVVHAYAGVLRRPISRADARRAVSADTGASEELCDYVWDLLDGSGCLVPGAAASADEPLLEFWASQGRDPVETQARLATTPVAVVAPQPARAVLLQALADCGIVTVPVATEGPNPSAELKGAIDDGVGLLACFGLAYGTSLGRIVNETGLEAGLPMLFGHVSGLVARIGPLVLPGATACLECAVLRMLAHAGAAEARVLEALRRSSDGVPPPAPVHPAFLRVAASLFSLEASTVALSLPSQTVGAVVELVQGEAQTRLRSVRRVPTCPACHPARPRRFGWDAAFRSRVLAGDDE